MATASEKWDELQDLKKALQESQDLYKQYAGGEYQVPELARKYIGEKINYNKGLVHQENLWQKQLNVSPYDYAQKFQEQGGRYANNPVLAGQAAAQREASIEQRLQDLRGVREERTGTIADVINAATSGYQAQTAQMKANADTAQQNYQNAFAEYQQLSDEEKFKMQLEAQAKSSSGGGSGGGSSGGGSSADLSQAIDDAIGIIYEEDDTQGGANMNGGNADKQLDANEINRAKSRINALAQRYGVDGNTLFQQAWGEYGASEYKWGNEGGGSSGGTGGSTLQNIMAKMLGKYK